MVRVARRITGSAGRRQAQTHNGSSHLNAMRVSTAITQNLRRMYWPEAIMIKPESVIRLLNDAKVAFVLVGSYGITGWRSEERATEDVDVLVRARDHRKAVSVIGRAFPNLLVAELPVVTRFSDPATGKVIVDVMKPRDKLLNAAFKNTVSVEEAYRIPSLEMALASKYAAMISPNRRQEKRLVDAADFVDIAKHNMTKIDFKKLLRLGELIYQGGGADILKCVDDIRQGEDIDFNALASKGELLP